MSTAVGLAMLVTVAAARGDELSAGAASALVGGFRWAFVGAAVHAAAAAPAAQ